MYTRFLFVCFWHSSKNFKCNNLFNLCKDYNYHFPYITDEETNALKLNNFSIRLNIYEVARLAFKFRLSGSYLQDYPRFYYLVCGVSLAKKKKKS